MARSLTKYKPSPRALIVLFLLVIYTDLFLVSVGLFIASPSDSTFDNVTIIRLLVIILFTCFVLFRQLPAVKGRLPRLYRIGLPMTSISFVALLANMDWVLSKTQPHSFSMPLTKLDSIYFTITTMVTVGYGDIVPRTEMVRLWVTIQIIIGAAFIAFIIQREIVARPKKPDKSEEST